MIYIHRRYLALRIVAPTPFTSKSQYTKLLQTCCYATCKCFGGEMAARECPESCARSSKHASLRAYLRTYRFGMAVFELFRLYAMQHCGVVAGT
jgi:hypothetical protein